MRGAVGVKTLEDILAEMGRESTFAVGGSCMHRAGAAPLLTAAVQLVEQAQMAQYLFESDLLTEKGIVDARPR